MRSRLRAWLIAVVVAMVIVVAAVSFLGRDDAPDSQPTFTVVVDASGWLADPSHGEGRDIPLDCNGLGETIVGDLLPDRSSEQPPTLVSACTWSGVLANSSVDGVIELALITRESEWITDQAEWRERLDTDVQPFAGCGAGAIAPVTVDAEGFPSRIGCINENGATGRKTSVAVANSEFGIVVRFTASPPNGDLDVLDDMDCCSRDDMLQATALMLSEAGNIVTHIPPTPTGS